MDRHGDGKTKVEVNAVCARQPCSILVNYPEAVCPFQTDNKDARREIERQPRTVSLNQTPAQVKKIINEQSNLTARKEKAKV